jgi:hypothetical protein
MSIVDIAFVRWIFIDARRRNLSAEDEGDKEPASPAVMRRMRRVQPVDVIAGIPLACA